jgi:hypothetical protein
LLIEPLEKILERHPGKLLEVEAQVGLLAVPSAQRVKEVPIRDPSGVSRQRPGNAGGTEDVKSFVFEPRDQAGVE